MINTIVLNDEVISKAKGFISWEHHYAQDNTDFVLWESEEEANNAMTVGQGYEVTKESYACIQMNTLVEHWFHSL